MQPLLTERWKQGTGDVVECALPVDRRDPDVSHPRCRQLLGRGAYQRVVEERRISVVPTPLRTYETGTQVAFLQAQDGNSAHSCKLPGDTVTGAVASKDDDRIDLLRLQAVATPLLPGRSASREAMGRRSASEKAVSAIENDMGNAMPAGRQSFSQAGHERTDRPLQKNNATGRYVQIGMDITSHELLNGPVCLVGHI